MAAASDADYERVITQVKTTGKVADKDKPLAQQLQREQGERGRRYRRAAGTDTSADSWGW